MCSRIIAHGFGGSCSAIDATILSTDDTLAIALDVFEGDAVLHFGSFSLSGSCLDLVVRGDTSIEFALHASFHNRVFLSELAVG